MSTNRFSKRNSYKLFTFAVGVFLVIQMIFVALNPLTGMVDENGAYTGYWFWIVNAVLQLSLIAATLVFCKISKINYPSAISITKKPNPRVLLAATGIAAGLFCLVYPIQTWIIALFEKLGYAASSSIPLDGEASTVVLLVFVIVILPAFAEEQLFRGALLGGLKDLGTINASLACGALFSLFHMNPSQTIYQFIMGFALAFVTLRADSLYPSMLVHLFNNLVVVVLALTVGDAADAFVAKYWYAFILVGACVCAACVYALVKLTPSTTPETATETDGKSDNTLRPVGGKTEKENRSTSDVLVLFAGVLACVIMWLTAFNGG